MSAGGAAPSPAVKIRCAFDSIGSNIRRDSMPPESIVVERPRGRCMLAKVPTLAFISRGGVAAASLSAGCSMADRARSGCKFVGRFHIVHISECTATHRAAGYAHPAYLRLTPRSKKPISVVMNNVIWLVCHPHLGLPSDNAHMLAKLRRIGEGRNEYQPNSGVFD